MNYQIKQRDIAISIILSFVTCGLYGIYWFVVVTDDIANVSGDYSITGMKAFLLILITCGIYSFYWAYKMGQQIDDIKRKQGMQTGGTETAIIYLILQIFGLQIVNLILMQSELNRTISTY